MLTYLTRLAGITYYGYLIHWRRGSLRLLMSMIVLVPFMITLIILTMLPEIEAGQSYWSLAYDAETRLTGMALFTLIPLAVVVFLLIPFLTAETIPMDRQYRVREYSDALPISSTDYLVGRVLSVWVGLLIAILLSILVNGLIFRALIGAFHLGLWLFAWIIVIAPLCLLLSGLSILLSAGHHTRRKALFNAIIAIPALVYLYAISPFMQLLYAASAPSDFLLHDPSGNLIGMRGLGVNELLPMIGAMLVALTIAGLCAWTWLHWQESRA